MNTPPLPDLLPDKLDVQGPAEPVLHQLLEHQAHLLAERTQHALRPLVQPKRGILSSNNVAYEFILVVPALDNYRYTLFTIEAGLEAPPAWLHTNDGPIELRTEDEIFAKLRELFAAPSTLRVIQNLLALAREAESDED